MSRLLSCVFGTWLALLASQATHADSVCVVSLLGDTQTDNYVEHQTRALTNRMVNAADISFRIHLKGTVQVYQNLRDCLEGAHEEVIIISHSAEVVSNHQFLVYNAGDLPHGEAALGTLMDRFFKTVHWSPNLKQMTLIACEPNEVVTRYPILTSSLAKHGISMRFAPISRWLSWWHGKPELRDALMAPLLIAEAAQPAQSDRFFCMIFRGSSQTPNEGTCLRGRYNISFAAEKLLPDEPVWMEFEHNADGELSASQVSFDAAFALRPLPVNALSLHPSGHIWSYNNSAFAVSRKY